MRFIITAMPDPDAPQGDPNAIPDDAIIVAHMKYNEELHKAGVLVAAEGLNPAAKGARIVVKGGKRVVLDGPYAETKELIGGFYLIDVKSREEAIEWALRCPLGLGFDDVLTIHPMTDEEDIPEAMRKIIREVAPEWSASWGKQR